MKFSDAVQLYMQLRDRKAQLKAEFDEAVAPVQRKMDQLEAKMLAAFNDAGMDSAKTEFGTAYVSTRSSASLADKDAFMAFVRERDEWTLTDIRVSKTAVEQYRDAHEGDIPPGVTLREERVVNVRKA